MSDNSPAPTRFHLDLKNLRLLRDGVEIPLTPKPFRALALLAKNAGNLVSQGDFLDHLWGREGKPDDLHQAIKTVRAALGDEKKAVILSRPRRGYVFQGNILRSDSETVVFENRTAPPPTPKQSPYRQWSFRLAACLAVLLPCAYFARVAVVMVSPSTMIPHARQPNPNDIRDVALREKSLAVTLHNGSVWERQFGSSPRHKLLLDTDGDGRSEVLTGLGGDGITDHSTVVLMSANGTEIWRYTQPANDPYGRASTGRLDTNALGVVQRSEGVAIAVLFNDFHWFPSVIALLSLGGKPLGLFWHPGQLRSLYIDGSTLYVTGVNNSLKKYPGLTGEAARFPGVLFAVDAGKLYGQGPPYAGNIAPNKDLLWYFLLNYRGVQFDHLEPGPNGGVTAWTSCGLVLDLSKAGKEQRRMQADRLICPGEIRLIPYSAPSQ